MKTRIAVVFVLLAPLAVWAAAGSPATQPLSSAAPTTKPTAAKAATTQPAVAKVPGPAELIAKLKLAKDAIAPEEPRVAYFDLARPISEKPSDFSFFAAEESTTLRSLLERMDRARQDKDLKAVLITLGGSAPNMSQALELRDSLLALKKAGKRTFVYADSYDSDSYLMASGATDVCLLGGGDVEMPGVGLQVMFAKGLFDKVGVEADFEQIGEFKGADEEYIHTQPSPEMAGELNRLVDSLYTELVNNIARNRNVKPDDVRAAIDRALIPADEAKKIGLVDHLIDVDGLRTLIGDELGGKIDLVHDYGEAPRENLDLSNPFAFFSLFAKHADDSDRQAVALIYAEGEIVDGSTSAGLFGGADQVGSEDIRQAIRLAERDDQIGAIVLRIDSPGGSALASEAMWQAVRRVSKSKPVVVSVGSMAASGGYYLASSADTIYADPSAIVGSIGVVGGKFVLHDLYEKLGLSTATFSRGANANLFGSDTPWTADQRQKVHNWMHETYDQFTKRVMTTRKGKIRDIDKVARGRIFMARQAKDLGMVDEIGGVSDAIAAAAKDADLAPGSYDVRVVPAPRTLADFFSGGPEAKMPFEPTMHAGDELLNALPAAERDALQQMIITARLFESRPVQLVCPYVIQTR